MALKDAFKLSIYAQLDSCACEDEILKFYQPHMGKQKPFKGIIEPHLGIIESLGNY